MCNVPYAYVCEVIVQEVSVNVSRSYDVSLLSDTARRKKFTSTDSLTDLRNLEEIMFSSKTPFDKNLGKLFRKIPMTYMLLSTQKNIVGYPNTVTSVTPLTVLSQRCCVNIF